MTDLKEIWKQRILDGITQLARMKGLETGALSDGAVVVETPPRAELGDLAFPLFPFARLFRASPAALAADLAGLLAEGGFRVAAAGPYLNVFVDRPDYIDAVHGRVREAASDFGRSASMAGLRVMVEFSSPNTNKPLHLGHLRNDALGESVARIIAAAGAEVRKVNLINDRGIHICKSMLAYEKFGAGATPESAGMKSDHFVGDYYVRFARWAAEEPAAEEAARVLLRRWEENDEAVRTEWKRMRAWAIDGIKATYARTGVGFDAYYFESEVYERGREEVRLGLASGAFYQEADGSIWIDLAEIGLDKKVLLRSDGTSLYLTQDLGTAIARYRDWPFDRLVYVVASEQNYHFMVLFHVLGKLGHPWAANLNHLSYGMVNLPEGKMKSREGTVVDADDLLDELADMAAEEIRKKEREEEVGDVKSVAEKIALGAIHYFLLQPSPAKDMVFNPKESLSFTGNTGPYLQYMGARISSMLRKYAENEATRGEFRAELLALDDEWELAKAVGAFPDLVAQAARGYNPSLVANNLYDLAKLFSRYYHDTPVLHNEDPDLVATRVGLCEMVLTTIRSGLYLLNIPFLPVM